MKKIALYTNNPSLHRRISLILNGIAEVDMTIDGQALGYSLVLVDKESFPDIESDHILPYVTTDGEIKTLPILHESIIELAKSTEAEEKSLFLNTSDRTVRVAERVIRLTDVEYKLLEVLLRHSSYVSREELLSEVWGGKKDVGVVNVYVHYLRNKLEANGDKIILSSRKEGYKIDKRWRTKC